MVLSDSSVAGEGEHKIVDFIRQERLQPGWDPTARLIICGLDADLILLSLALHEQHVCILREEVFTDDRCFHCGSFHHKGWQCNNTAPVHRKLQLLDVSILRQCLAQDFGIHDLVFGGAHSSPEVAQPGENGAASSMVVGVNTFDAMSSSGSEEDGDDDENEDEELDDDESAMPDPLLFHLTSADVNSDDLGAYDSTGRNVIRLMQVHFERVVDDFVCLAAFVGNDFLPHLPSVELKEGALDFVIELYKELLQSWPVGEYLVELVQGDDGAHVAIDRRKLGEFLGALGATERFVFHNRRNQELKQQRWGRGRGRGVGQEQSRSPTREHSGSGAAHGTHTKFDEDGNPVSRPALATEEEQQDNGSEPPDALLLASVELWQPDYKERFYEKCAQVPSAGGGHDDTGAGDWMAERDFLCRIWCEGLSWCMDYYYLGVPSWRWFYGSHYAPFCSDLASHLMRASSASSGDSSLRFRAGRDSDAPFQPIKQLMAVLPPASAHLVPEACGQLMTDPDSPIASFYPTRFLRDPNGADAEWKWLVMLPFVDETRLAAAMESVVATLTPDELERNRPGATELLVSASSRVATVGVAGASLALTHESDGVCGTLENLRNVADPLLPPTETRHLLAPVQRPRSMVGDFRHPEPRAVHVPEPLGGHAGDSTVYSLRKHRVRRKMLHAVDASLALRLFRKGAQVDAPPLVHASRSSRKAGTNIRDRSARSKRAASKDGTNAGTQSSKSHTDSSSSAAAGMSLHSEASRRTKSQRRRKAGGKGKR